MSTTRDDARPTVRLLTQADAAAYRSIRLATLRTEPAYFGALHDEEAARPMADFDHLLRHDRVFAAVDGEALIGVARLHGHAQAKERHKASLHGVFVQPGWRGRGVGSALLRAAIAAAGASYERLVLTVAAENATAILLYERLGFVRFGVEPQARKHDGRYVDVVSMSLKLDRPA